MIVTRCTVSLRMFSASRRLVQPYDELKKSKVGDRVFRFVDNVYGRYGNQRVIIYLKNNGAKNFIRQNYKNIKYDEIVAVLMFLIRANYQQISITKAKGITYPSKRNTERDALK